MKTIQKYRVIIAHSDPSAQRRIACALDATKLFQIIFTTQNGEACINHAVRSQPDLVIADTLLMGVDGLEVLRQIKTRSSDIQVILLTNYYALANHHMVLELADYCLLAPFTDAVLAQRAVDTIHSHRSKHFPIELVNNQTAAVLGILSAPVRMKGYAYLHDGIQLSVHNPDILYHHTGPNGLYAQLCARHHECYRNIERCMRSVSDYIFKNSCLSVMEEYFTPAIRAREHISNLTLISVLAARVTDDLKGMRQQEATASRQ